MAKSPPTTPEQPAPRWLAARRLGRKFPDVPMPDIVRCLVDARRSVEAFGLAREDERKMAERLAITMLEDRRALRARAQ